MRAIGAYHRRRSSWRSPGSRARSVHACQGLRPRRVRSNARDNASARMAFRPTDSVGTRNKFSFAALWLAYTLPCRRFADTLTGACARLGADVVRYPFIVGDLHPLLLAGLPAHLLKNSKLHSPRILATVHCNRQFTRRIVGTLVRRLLVARNKRSHAPPHPRRSDASAGLEFLE
jgi:hypothetical protein